MKIYTGITYSANEQIHTQQQWAKCFCGSGRLHTTGKTRHSPKFCTATHKYLSAACDALTIPHAEIIDGLMTILVKSL